jgi:hypothetical protein
MLPCLGITRFGIVTLGIVSQSYTSGMLVETFLILLLKSLRFPELIVVLKMLLFRLIEHNFYIRKNVVVEDWNRWLFIKVSI